jgi:hypothetical protein
VIQDNPQKADPHPEKKKFPWEDDKALNKYDQAPIKSINDSKPMIPSIQP